MLALISFLELVVLHGTQASCDSSQGESQGYFFSLYELTVFIST